MQSVSQMIAELTLRATLKIRIKINARELREGEGRTNHKQKQTHTHTHTKAQRLDLPKFNSKQTLSSNSKDQA
jgi:hypothetical protein